MSDLIDASTGLRVPRDNMVSLTHVIYALHAFSALAGVVSSAFIVTAFLTGWPSLIAVVLNYVYRSDPDVVHSHLLAHFRWQIRTFWFALLWVVVAILLGLSIIGLPLGILIAIICGLWVLYRIVRGWLALSGGRGVGEG